tara:strand:- start:395 stop:625 length:231 start_codon:yes stop_codon:yes gene_type:complete
MNKVIMIKCGSCDEEFNYYSSKYRPFCSERCKMIDLGQWLTESYAIPSQQPLTENDVNKVLEHHRANGSSLDDEEN